MNYTFSIWRTRWQTECCSAVLGFSKQLILLKSLFYLNSQFSFRDDSTKLALIKTFVDKFYLILHVLDQQMSSINMRITILFCFCFCFCFCFWCISNFDKTFSLKWNDKKKKKNRKTQKNEIKKEKAKKRNELYWKLSDHDTTNKRGNKKTKKFSFGTISPMKESCLPEWKNLKNVLE